VYDAGQDAGQVAGTGAAYATSFAVSSILPCFSLLLQRNAASVLTAFCVLTAFLQLGLFKY
jgi:hypothetical protein